ncbi:MAG TPA: nucleoside triphosphate pyrophosphohydrolase [Vicinamibacterales bacterium]|nr:nucleoside triphosphate pyrophosphohydrolase [Vicinamibacterales bacterium]
MAERNRTRGKAVRADARRRRTTSKKRPGSKVSAARTGADAGHEFQKLVDIMKRLRGPDGCPWDREQTLETLRPFVLEETYEVLDAIDRRDHDALRGEIGDFLFEGVFLAQLEADAGRFTVADSLRLVAAKLVRRHPHVFGSRQDVRTPGQVLEQWEQIKAREQQETGMRKAVLAGLPKTLPALLGASEIGTRVAAVGFDWPAAADVIAKIEEEVAELREAVGRSGAGGGRGSRGSAVAETGSDAGNAQGGRARIEEEMGDLLFSIANLARKLGIEPESALRKANAKFTERFAALERHLEAEGRSVHDATLDELENAWSRVKIRP